MIFRKKISLIAWIAVVSVLMYSCSPYKKIAKTYYETPPGYNFMLLFPDFIYKENLKEYEIENKDSLTEREVDSLLYTSSIYLTEIVDSVFIDSLSASLSKNLKTFGFNVYTQEDMDDFLNISGQSYIVNLAQLLLEEYVYPYEAEAVIFDEVISVSDIDLNALNINLWFELTPYNSDNEAARVLFTSDQIFDDMEGEFTGGIFGSNMRFEYTIDSLQVGEIYYAATALGRKYAMYFNDYFLNRYLIKNLPEGYDLENYYHLSPESGKIYPIDEEYRFIEMDME
jgi:hypothetical protein